VIRGGRGLYDYLQGVQSYLAPPIFVVFFLGVFYKRLNAKGCLWALVTGFALGIIRLAVDTPVKMVQGFQYTEGSFLWIVNNIFFQYYSMIILFVSAAVMIGVSHMTAAPDYGKISGLTYGTRTETDKMTSRASWKPVDVLMSVIVVALILAAYLYFVG
jgi:SSS family solute:Na+ symporter